MLVEYLVEVSNMLLVLSITFYCHYNIWDCTCSTGPFQFRWLKGYFYSSCYHHHQIGSIYLSHCYIFPWSPRCLRCLLHHILSLITYTFWENQNFVFFIIIAQFMMSAINNSQIHFGLQIICSLSYPLYNMWGCEFQLTYFPYDDWKNIYIYFVLSSSSNWKYELLSIVYG